MRRKRKYEVEISSVDYIKGVKDCDGNLVIRALNEEEKSFLKKFNEEFVGGNFKESGNLHDGLIADRSAELENLKVERQKLRDALKAHSRSYKSTYSGSVKREHSEKKNLLKEQILVLNERILKVGIKEAIWEDRYSKRLDMYHNDVIAVSGLFNDQETRSESEMFDCILGQNV